MGPLLRCHAPLLEELAVCLMPADGDEPAFHESIAEPTPRFALNVRAPNLRRIQLAGVLPATLAQRDTEIYPRVTHAVITMNTDFAAKHARALLPRFPALTHLALRRLGYPPDDLALAWFAHPAVRHFAPDLVFCRGAGPETFPRLESADFSRAGEVGDPAAAAVLAPTGPFNAVRRLRLLVPYYDVELVHALDVLPRLESAFLDRGVLTPSFVALETWRGATWKCLLLQELVLHEAREVQPVETGAILAWLRERNSSAREGKHKAFRHFSIEWKTRPESLEADFEVHIGQSLGILR